MGGISTSHPGVISHSRGVPRTRAQLAEPWLCLVPRALVGVLVPFQRGAR